MGGSMQIEEVLKSAKNGCNESVNYIMNQYDPLIKSVSSRYYSNIHQFDDFMQLARMGIWSAIQSYPLRQYYVQKVDGKVTFRLNKSYKSEHHFIGWMKMSIRHEFAREIRKENQVFRKTNKLTISDDEAVLNVSDCGRNIDSVHEKLMKVAKVKLCDDEMICLQSVLNGDTQGQIVSKVKEAYPHFTGDDAKMAHKQMLSKVKFEVLNFA